MLRYLTLLTILIGVGVGLGVLGNRPHTPSFTHEPDFEIFIEPLQNVFSETRQQSLCLFDADFVSLYLQDKGGVKRVEHDFCSAYQGAKARLVKDGLGRNYLFLETGEGRGTNATVHFLSVYRIVGDHLRLVMKTELDWATDIQARFGYTYTVRAKRTGGIELVFTGELSGQGDSSCCVPPEWNRVIQIDAH